MLPGHRGAGRRRRAGQRRHHRAPRSPPRPWRPAPRSSTTSPAGWPTRTMAASSPSAGCRTSRCTGAGTAPDMQALAVYDDVVGRGARRARRAASTRRSRAGRRGRPVVILDPGLGLRQDAPSTTGRCSRHLDELVGARPPGAVSAPRASRSSALAAAPASGPARRGPRRRHRRDQRAGRRGRRLGRTRARRASRPSTPSTSSTALGSPRRRTVADHGPHHAHGRAGTRLPRRLRLRAARRAGVRRRRASSALDLAPGRRPATTSPTRCTTARSAPPCWPGSRASPSTSSSGSPSWSPTTRSATPAVDEVTVTVHKPQAPVGVPFGDVTVAVTRRRPPVPVVVARRGEPAPRGAPPARHRPRGGRGAHPASGVTVVATSALHDTDPVGGPEQPTYVNAVVTARTSLSPTSLLRALHGSRPRSTGAARCGGARAPSTSTSCSTATRHPAAT